MASFPFSLDAFTVFAQSEHIFYSLFPKVKVCLHITLFKSKIEIEPAIMILQVEMLFSDFICMDHFSHPQAPPSKYNLPHTSYWTDNIATIPSLAHNHHNFTSYMQDHHSFYFHQFHHQSLYLQPLHQELTLNTLHRNLQWKE